MDTLNMVYVIDCRLGGPTASVAFSGEAHGCYQFDVLAFPDGLSTVSIPRDLVLSSHIPVLHCLTDTQEREIRGKSSIFVLKRALDLPHHIGMVLPFYRDVPMARAMAVAEAITHEVLEITAYRPWEYEVRRQALEAVHGTSITNLPLCHASTAEGVFDPLPTVKIEGKKIRLNPVRIELDPKYGLVP